MIFLEIWGIFFYLRLGHLLWTWLARVLYCLREYGRPMLLLIVHNRELTHSEWKLVTFLADRTRSEISDYLDKTNVFKIIILKPRYNQVSQHHFWCLEILHRKRCLRILVSPYFLGSRIQTHSVLSVFGACFHLWCMEEGFGSGLDEGGGFSDILTEKN